MGTNGAGKTTIIKHLAGILKQDAGEMDFDGKRSLVGGFRVAKRRLFLSG